MTPIKNFTEKKIRSAILKKAKPTIKSKDSKHWMGEIYSNGILVTTVKIPNEHNRNMFMNKSKFIARDLKLNNHQFNEFIECHLTEKEYSELVAELK